MNGRKVIVADDEPHIRHLLALKLQQGGLEVLMAADGAEALELCLSEKPDLLITDYQMPVLSGLELCQRLRADPLAARIPAILLTARGFELKTSQTAELGIDLVMSKPFSPAEMLQKAVELLNRHEMTSQET